MAARKGRQATRGGTRQPPAWVLLGIGALLGAVLASLFLMKDWAPMLRKKNLPQPNPEATAPPAGDTAIADEAKPKPKKNFDFYQVLPEQEVVIPDAELSAKARAEAAARVRAAQQPGATTAPPEAASAAGGRYILQAGSYPDPRAADEVKAKLALLGFVAQVQPVTVNGKVWNRVRLGPYATASELETAKQALAGNGIPAVALKETK